jgi:hypothetical protein
MSYQPDPDALPLLGQVTAKLATATLLPTQQFQLKPKFLARLQTGQIYMDSELQLDTDGWAGGANGDGTHRDDTSWNYADGNTPINANEVSYYVLPEGGWDAQYHINLGDYAAVIYKTKLAFAVFADRGESYRIGEGSIQLLRQLGFERINANGSVNNVGTPPGVITIIFPGSGQKKSYPNQAALLADLNSKAKPLLDQLRNTPPAPLVA